MTPGATHPSQCYSRLGTWLGAGLWLILSMDAALAQRGKAALARTISEGIARGPSTQTQIVTAVGLIVAAALITGSYYLHRHMQRQQRDEAKSIAQTALSRIRGAMTAPSQLKPGDLVEIEYVGEKSRRVYASRVQEVESDTLLLAAPRQEGAIIPLRTGDRIGVIVRGRPFSYRFQTTILDRQRRPLPGLRVERVNQVTRYQRRAFFRVKVDIECEFEVFSGGLQPSSLSRKGRVTNLSGSGCRVVTTRPLGRARYIVMTFALPNDTRRIRATAEVVKKNTSRATSAQDGSVACNFIEIQHVDRERMVKYVMSADRKNIRRQKGTEAMAPRRHPPNHEVVTPKPARGRPQAPPRP